MSSATSIERLQPERSDGVKPAEGRPSPAHAGFRPWHFFVLLSLLAATAAVVMVRQPSPERLVLLSLTIGAAGLCGAALYGVLAPLVRRDPARARRPVSERERAGLEREKMLVLRSIKEIEFDRAMGKMSQADFDELASRLRARALSLMKQLDAGPTVHAGKIEQELEARLAPAPVPARTCACGTANDSDASFCKRCGNRLA